jgi:predicted dehydrogenase
VKIGIVGAGSIGGRHARNLVYLGFEDIVIADVSEKRVDELVQSLKVGSGASPQDPVLDTCDVMFICTPPPTHLPYALRFARKGISLFVEKPLSVNLDGLDSLVAELSRGRLVTMVGCNYRFELGMLTLREKLRSGCIGHPLFATASFGQDLRTWRQVPYAATYSAHRDQGGGVWFDRIHELDYLSWLFGLPTAGAAFFGNLGELRIDAEETALAALVFPGPVLASITLDYLSPAYRCTLSVVGTGGTLEWGFRPSYVNLRIPDASPVTLFDEPECDSNLMYLDEIKHFVAAVQTGGPTIHSIEDAATLLRIAIELHDQGRFGDTAVLKRR